LLDEPLIGLDAVTKSRIIDDLRAWNREHEIPIIYVTHDRDEVAALGERLIVLENGTIVAQGGAREVLDYPELETVAHLAGFENIFDVTVVAIHDGAGTMTCRIDSTDVTIETPIVRRRPDVGLKLGLRAGDILLATEPPRNISARNILPGIVVALEHGARFETLHVNCGVLLKVHVTKGAVESLQLRTGTNVWILVKTNSCHLLAT
jgi:molybdate transport system ATP-binding protein